MVESSKAGTNWVDGGFFQGPFIVPFLLAFAPMFVQVLGYITSGDHDIDPKLGVSGLLTYCYEETPFVCIDDMFSFIKASYVRPTMEAVAFLAVFSLFALLLDVSLPGKIHYGPETLTGHIPDYKDNAMLHCIIFTTTFILCSNIGIFNFYDFGIFYDTFPACITILNIFGMVFALFLCIKGLYFPSTADSGSSGSFFVDFTWGTELYPRIFGVDVKRYINCRFSMTYWLLAGLSYSYKSYKIHDDTIDYGLLFGAISQFLYLVKFFSWEIGYMQSIDIIVDRAGWEIQWGCLCWVPAVYTLHSRFLVQNPSNLSLPAASLIAGIGFAGVLLNYWADLQRQKFRESDGKMLIFGKYKPVIVEAKYTIIDTKTGKLTTRTSLLLASGFWGIARHFHYTFELIAAWSWTLLTNPMVNGVLPLVYSVFLTCLLADRAKRDERKCKTKYGKYYDIYSDKVPYLIVPGIY